VATRLLSRGCDTLAVTGGLPLGSAGELRFYWSPGQRALMGGYMTFAVAAVAGLAATSHRLWNPVWLGATLLVCLAVVVIGVTYIAAVAGVRETATGLEWRTGPRWRRAFGGQSGQVAWVDVRAFAYVRVTPLAERVVVSCGDGTRKVIWSAPRQMRWGWRGSSTWTDDFAELLTERSRAFGAPIEASPNAF